jgi:hypothetical protein
VADLTPFKADELHGVGEFAGGVSHGELDDLAAWDATHVFSAGVGHVLLDSEVAGIHVWSAMLEGLVLKNLLAGYERWALVTFFSGSPRVSTGSGSRRSVFIAPFDDWRGFSAQTYNSFTPQRLLGSSKEVVTDFLGI